MRATIMAGIALLALPVAAALGQTDDRKVRILGHERVKAAFAKGSPLIEVGDYKIHASRRESKPGLAEIHTRDTDIIYVLEGSATLVTGGEAVGAKPTGEEELRGSAIEGGDSREITVGDVVVVPNGTPHWFKKVDGPLLYYVVKVRQQRRDGSIGAMR